jgi:hypothetical protein
MSRISPDNIKTERDLQVALKDLERRWGLAHNIKDSRRRSKEILRLKGEVKYMLSIFKDLNRSTNLNDNNDNGLWNRMIRTIASWFGIINKKYKDV